MVWGNNKKLAPQILLAKCAKEPTEASASHDDVAAHSRHEKST